VREAKAGSEKAQRLFLISTVRHQVAGTATNVKRWLKTGNRKGRFREPPVPAVPARPAHPLGSVPGRSPNQTSRPRARRTNEPGRGNGQEPSAPRHPKPGQPTAPAVKPQKARPEPGAVHRRGPRHDLVQTTGRGRSRLVRFITSSRPVHHERPPLQTQRKASSERLLRFARGFISDPEREGEVREGKGRSLFSLPPRALGRAAANAGGLAGGTAVSAARGRKSGGDAAGGTAAEEGEERGAFSPLWWESASFLAGWLASGWTHDSVLLAFGDRPAWTSLAEDIYQL
jgi:hypothetical protein